MNVWRLMAYHVPEHAAEVAQREGVIAIGHGGAGDLSQRPFRSANELSKRVANADPNRTVAGCVNDGLSMWRLYNEMRIGDLVIVVSGGKRLFTMSVTGEYYFVDGEHPPYYEHRRKAEPVPVDPNRLWQISGRTAQGENVRSALIRCAHTLNEAEYKALLTGPM